MADKPKEGPLPDRETDHKIPIAQAIEYVRRYRRSSPASEKGGFFWAAPVRKLLSYKDVVGLRYYHGLDAKGAYHIILVGVDKNGNDVVRQVVGAGTAPTKGGGKTAGKTPAKAMMALSADGDDLLEEHFPCPPFCPPGGPFA